MNDVTNTSAQTAPKPQHRKRSIFSFLRLPTSKYGLLLLLIAGLVTAAYLFYAARPLEVEIAKIENNVTIRVFGLGKIDARVRSDVGFEVGATLAA